MYNFEIMLNKSCVGSWGTDSDMHIPHEIINSFRADNGMIYLYVPPSGGFSTTTHKRIKYIVVTGAWNKGRTEILYVATELTPMHNGGKFATEDERKIQRDYIHQNNITYYGKYLDEIEMSDNKEERIFYITFRVGRILFPKSRLFLSWNSSDSERNDDNIFVMQNSEYRYQRQTGFLSGADLKKVASIIENPDYWDNSKMVETVGNNTNKSLLTSMPSLIHFIGKEYDESAMTNLLYYYFQGNPSVFHTFTKEVLSIQEDDLYTLERESPVESGRIDLLAVGKKYILIIENKIKSGLHGIDKHNQLSQLSRYYQDISKKNSGKNIRAFLLTPNYNDIDIGQFDPDAADKYKKIKYSIIKAFFEKQRTQFHDTILLKYYDDLLSVLGVHSMTMQETVRMRFLRAIQNSPFISPDTLS